MTVCEFDPNRCRYGVRGGQADARAFPQRLLQQQRPLFVSFQCQDSESSPAGYVMDQSDHFCTAMDRLTIGCHLHGKNILEEG
jgi:hypothetical protein